MSENDESVVLGGMHVCRPAPLDMKVEKPVGLRLMSDLHIGAAHVDYAMINKEIEDAAAHNDRVLINGDLLDLILPKDAKRHQPSAVHPRLNKRDDQINAAVAWAVEILSPVAHLIDMLGVGNHESVIVKYHSVDPTLLVLYELEKIAKQRDPDHVIHYGGFTGFVDYRLHMKDYVNGGGFRWIIYYHHGSGGAAPVTRGIIDFNRRDVFVDADMIWLGHKHQKLVVSVEKLRCPKRGDDVDVREIHHVMTGAYFKTYVGQNQASIREHGRRSNYAADAGLAPGGRGGVRVVITSDRSSYQRPTIKIIQ